MKELNRKLGTLIKWTLYITLGLFVLFVPAVGQILGGSLVADLMLDDSGHGDELIFPMLLGGLLITVLQYIVYKGLGL